MSASVARCQIKSPAQRGGLHFGTISFMLSNLEIVVAGPLYKPVEDLIMGPLTLSYLIMGLMKATASSQYEQNQYTPGHAGLLKMNYSNLYYMKEAHKRHRERRREWDDSLTTGEFRHFIYSEVLSWLTFQKVGCGNISSASAANYSWMAPPSSS